MQEFKINNQENRFSNEMQKYDGNEGIVKLRTVAFDIVTSL